MTNLAVLASGCCSAAVVSGLGGGQHLARSYSRTQVSAVVVDPDCAPFHNQYKTVGDGEDRCSAVSPGEGSMWDWWWFAAGQSSAATTAEERERGAECESTRTDDGRRRRRRRGRLVVVRRSCVGSRGRGELV